MMFSSERMGKSKFGFNMNPITEYAKGGGGGSSPPPRDWSPEWKKVTDSANEAGKMVVTITDEVKETKLEEDWRTKQARINTEISAAISKIDEAVNLDYTIPSSWFGADTAKHDTVINNLKAAKDNLQKMIDRRAPTALDLIKDELIREQILLAQSGRVISRPKDAAPPDNVYPTGTWQRQLWEKGYALDEIAWLEDDVAAKKLERKTHGNRELFMLYAEDELDRAILNGNVKTPVKKEIISQQIFNCGTDYFASNTIADGQPVVKLPLPPGCQADSNYYRVLNRRAAAQLSGRAFRGYPRYGNGVAKGGLDRRYLPYIDPNYPNINNPFVNPVVYGTDGIPIAVAPGTGGSGINPADTYKAWCGGNYTGKDWESVSIGAGATPAEVQIIRDIMNRSKYPPNVTLPGIALDLLGTIRSTIGNDADTNANTQTDSPTGLGYSLNNPYGLGIAKNVPNPLEVLLAHNRGRKQTQRARRAAIR